MRINTNISSILAQRNLATTTNAIARAMERLSTGRRINRAGDDAAGLAISERLQSQARGFERNLKNINESFGILQTAEGAVSSQMELAQRMRELAIQSANGSLATTDRKNLDRELQQLLEEFNRIARATEFNGVKLLDGSFESVNIQVGVNKGEVIEIGIESTIAESLETTVDNRTFTGLGTWSQTSTASGTQTGNVYFDINGDGLKDLFSSGRSAASLEYVSLANGDGTFTLVSSANLGAISSVSFADLNGDDKMDFVATDDINSRFKAYIGDGTGGFTQTQTIQGTAGNLSAPLTGDFNEDGKQDAIFRDGSAIVLYLGNGDGTISFSATVHATSPISNLIEAVDIDNDGNLDIVGHDTSLGAGVIYYGTGTGTFEPVTTVDLGSAGLSIADLDGDDDLDFFSLSASGDGLIYSVLQTGTRTFGGLLSSNISGNIIAQLGSLGDWTGDGVLDAVVQLNSGTTYLYSGIGDGYFNLTPEATIPGRLLGMNSGEDLNGDDIADILFYDSVNHIWITYLQDTSVSGELTTESIPLPSIDTQENAQNALETINLMIENLSGVRSRIGAQFNRLESAENTTQLMVENISTARSRILDADVAEDTAEFTRLQVLQQAGVSVLTQANLSSQLLLKLLRF